MNLILGYLYPDLMNIYGDQGNVIALKKRCEWRGIDFEIKNISLKESVQELKKCDLFFFGGGQDKQQILVAKNLHEDKGKNLKEMLNNNIPLLSICGGFQLLGKFYHFEGKMLPGINFFDIETKAGKTRFINNILTDCKAFALQPAEALLLEKKGMQNESFANKLVGFENHSGRTYLFGNTEPLAKVIYGHGNNGEDKTEGAVKKNAIGTYLHGSILPKNPHLADFIIKKALEKKYDKTVNLTPLDDKLEWQAHQAALKLF